jgi:hypothetical protein
MINPDETVWNSDNINKAKEFMVNTMNTDITSDLILKYGIGELNNNNTSKYGILACYKYCKISHIDLDINITSGTLYSITRMLLYDKMTLISNLLSLNESTLINSLISHNMLNPVVRYDRLILFSQFITEILHKNMEREYYIAWAALRLDINLLDYEMPYLAITLYPEYNKYENTNMASLLKDSFEPRLPPECYKLSTLKHLSLTEGLEIMSDDRRVYHSRLVDQRSLNTFYKGKHNITNDTSQIYYNDICDIKEEHCISYGSYMSTVCIPIIELEENLVHHMDFVDMDGIPLTKESVNKLMRIASSSTGDLHIQLKNTINSIHNRLSKLNENDRQFVLYYKNSSKKDTIREFMLQCLNCSMSMRGWDGISPSTYPLDGVSSLRENTIFSNVSIALTRINEFEEQEPEIYEKIMTMDLYAINNGLGLHSWKRDRTGVLKKKFTVISDNNPNNVEACIRTNSNWILGTIYHYSDLIGVTYGFSMNDVRFIF